MPETSTEDSGERTELTAEERRRRRRAAELLGELLPEVTTDETAEAWEEHRAASRDEQMRRDVPPHHGG